MFLVLYLDRVAKLYYLILERENIVHTSNAAEKFCPWKCVMCTLHSTLNTSMHQKAHGLPLTLKGLGHAILRNFSTDQMVIELTKI